MFLRHYVTAHPTTLVSVVTRLNGSCRTRRFLQNSTVLAELDGSCRTRRFLQNSTVLKEIDGSRRQNSAALAELDGSFRESRRCRPKSISAHLFSVVVLGIYV